MANLRADNLTGSGGRNAIDGSVFFSRGTSTAAGDYLSFSGISVGTSDFTIEGWLYKTKTENYPVIVDTRESGNTDAAGFFFGTDSSGYLYYYTQSTNAIKNTIISNHCWNHFALVRASNTTTLYINGVSSGTYSDANNYTRNITRLGSSQNTGIANNWDWGGYLSNVRITIGTAVYTTAFTPPTEKLTAVDGTVLLCCQDSDDPTQEATGKTITAYGNLDYSLRDYNLITNGDFDTSATDGWTVASGSAALGTAQSGTFGNLNHLVLTSGTMTQAFTTVIGRTYFVNAQSNGADSSFISTTASSGDAIITDIRSSPQTGSGVRGQKSFVATQTTYYVILTGGGGGGNFDTVSVYEAESPKAQKVVPPVGVDEGVTFEGDTKVNSLGYMYFPTGTTEQRGRGRALMAGSNPASKTISYLNIQSQGNSSYFGDLITAGDGLRGGSSSTRGLFAHSAAASPYTTDIEYVTIANESNAIDFGNLTDTSSSGATGGNDTRAIFWEGTVPSTGVNICYATIATKGDALTFADMHLGVRHIDTMNSSTRCVIPGGWRASPDINTSIIQYVTIATLADAQDFGDVALANGMRASGAFSSTTRGVYGGGANSPSNSVLNTIEYITIATTGDATDFGDLTTARRVEGGGTSSHTRGLFTGGHTPTQINTIDYITIASTGNAQDFGDSTSQKTCGALSDCHGGLS